LRLQNETIKYRWPKEFVEIKTAITIKIIVEKEISNNCLFFFEVIIFFPNKNKLIIKNNSKKNLP